MEQFSAIILARTLFFGVGRDQNRPYTKAKIQDAFYTCLKEFKVKQVRQTPHTINYNPATVTFMMGMLVLIFFARLNALSPKPFLTLSLKQP